MENSLMEAVIGALIQLCLVVLVVYVVLWVISQLGISLPPQVVNIIWIIVALFALLLIVRNLLPKLGLKVFMVGAGLL